ncbi:MAG: uroporphyrinogen decarboxylase, partial [Planctomycetes bacterium]|nr:uroporphyrinogen decarboxylase [Planctomycetota bacterium]
DEVALYGLICGPFTLALHLIGNDIFLDMFDDEDKVKEIIDFCAEVGKKASEAYIAAGCDVVAIVDPMTSQISPDHFDEFVGPYVNKIFDYVHEKGALGSMFVCGDATRNLENMCKTTCDNVSIDENISLELLRGFAENYGKSYGGNLKLTVVLLLGTEQDSKIDTLRCLDAATGSKGFVLAPGCDLPYAVPPKNMEAVAELVHDEYKREVARTIVAAPSSDAFDDIAVPDYASENKVIVDLITLDSATCAPCQYMTEAANRAAEKFGADVSVREHKVTTRDGLGYMTKLGVANIPTLCIDGKAEFISIIPDQPTLVKAIEDKVAAKCGAAK